MELLPDIDRLAAGPPFVVTLGAFDGLHRGHLHLLRATMAEAGRQAAATAVIVFEPHPDLLFHGAAPALLLDPRERRARLAAAGVDLMVEQHFDRAFASQTAEGFVRRVAAHGALRSLVLTPESAFGRDRGGTAASLAPLADSLGVAIRTVEPLAVAGEFVSSNTIRSLIGAGRLGAAGRLLGRRPAVIGDVVHGDGRGRLLGFPTANLSFGEPVALPPDGIYAVEASWGGSDPVRPDRRAAGAASLGVRPMFAVEGRILEVYLLDVDEDLYDVRLRIEFVRRLRGERRFDSLDALVAQMRHDVARARAVLAP
jgi:riboflavin kinase/FMN adenylyltransferase